MIAKNRILLLATISALTTGCATISEEQCRLGDWYQVGLADGQTGKKNMAADYNKDCAEYKVSVDVEKYNTGRETGLRSYCSYENGVLMGEQGSSYENVCPADLSKEFLSGYRPYYNVTVTENAIRDKRMEAERLKESVKSEDISAETRAEYKAQFKVVKGDIKELKNTLSTYEYELALHKINREIAQVESKLEDASEEDKPELTARLKDLKETRGIIEDVQITETGIKTIKEIIDLF
jgi:hypothetical protein